eukprot:3939980-Rhodomonas_salina.1
MQRDQHAFMERMVQKSSETQLQMMRLLSGNKSAMLEDDPTKSASRAEPSAAEGNALNSSFESRFDLLEADEEEDEPSLVDSSFLITQQWNESMRADFAFGRFDGDRLDECKKEIQNVLARKGLNVLFPFPLAENA